MDKKAVREALLTVENALSDDDFREWLEKHQQTLDYEYDQYAGGFWDGEPESFEEWALWRYVNQRKEKCLS